MAGVVRYVGKQREWRAHTCARAVRMERPLRSVLFSIAAKDGGKEIDGSIGLCKAHSYRLGLKTAGIGRGQESASASEHVVSLLFSLSLLIFEKREHISSPILRSRKQS